MHFRSQIVVERPIEDVNRFFEEPTSLARWDRAWSGGPMGGRS